MEETEQKKHRGRPIGWRKKKKIITDEVEDEEVNEELAKGY